MDTYHQQLLLEYLGFSPGELDGKPGQKTKQACREFQKAYGLTADGVCGVQTEKALRGAVAGTMEPIARDTNVPGKTVTFWDEIKYFTRAEFRCPCPRCGGFPAEPAEKLVRIADKVREAAGNKAHVSSGVRCREHNAELPNSSSTSRHMTGKAMDFCIDGLTSAQLDAIVGSQAGVAYHYKINDRYVHMDII